MRVIHFLVLALLFMPMGAWAQDQASFYRITDVVVDVSAASAAQARDEAVIQAHRQAFEQLIGRLGAEGVKGAKPSDDMIAGFVQAFEVQKEHAVGKRYMGTYTVQFKPEPVRNYLGGHGVNYSERQSRPMVILPVLHDASHDVLWEDRTPWRAAWEEAGKGSVLVPVIVPAGDLEDIAKISTAEAMTGKAEALAAMAQKYDGGGVLVAILHAQLDAPEGKDVKVEVRRYDAQGKASPSVTVKLPSIAAATAVPTAMTEAVKQVIKEIENGWKQTMKPILASGPPVFLSVDVPVPTLAAWAQMRNKLAQIPLISRTNVVTMARGLVRAEIEFHGTIPDLQAAVGGAGLTLEQGPTGGWELK